MLVFNKLYLAKSNFIAYKIKRNKFTDHEIHVRYPILTHDLFLFLNEFHPVCEGAHCCAAQQNKNPPQTHCRYVFLYKSKIIVLKQYDAQFCTDITDYFIDATIIS